MQVYLRKQSGNVVGFEIQASYNERALLKSFGASWCSGSKRWHLPLDADLEQLLERAFVVLSDEVADWLDELEKFKNHLRALQRQKDAEVRFPDRLEPYQRVGVRYLADAKRALLADDVGLGKSAQSIRAAMEVDASRVLIITKKSLTWNWANQVQAWAGLPAEIYNTKSKAVPGTKFVITHYEAAALKLDSLSTVSWDVLIVDESAYVKNRKANRSRAVSTLAKDIPYVWLLSATPAPNGVWELWSQLNMLYPQMFPSYWRFVDKYCYTEDTPFGIKFLPGIKHSRDFEKNVACFILRRDKSVLGLPPISFETVYVEPTAEQRKLYQSICRNFLAEVSDGNYLFTPNRAAQILRLRQVLCSPALVGGNPSSGKTDALLDLLDEYTPSRKVLVFTTFAEYVKLLLPELEKRYNAVAITGAMSADRRWESVAAFQNDPRCRVLIGTIGAMGEGLNLQEADIVVFLDKDWVPSNNMIQAVGRAHRRGRTRPVHVISLLVSNSIDEYIEEVLQDKLETHEAFERIVNKLRLEEGGVLGEGTACLRDNGLQCLSEDV